MMNKKIMITGEQADLVRQWFNAIQDLNPGYLTLPDYELVFWIYRALDMRVPDSIAEKLPLPLPALRPPCCGGGPQWGHALDCPECPD